MKLRIYIAMMVLLAGFLPTQGIGCCIGCGPGECGSYDDYDPYPNDDDLSTIAHGYTQFDGAPVAHLRIDMLVSGDLVDRGYTTIYGAYHFVAEQRVLESREQTGFTLHLVDHDGPDNGHFHDEIVEFTGNEVPVDYDFHLVPYGGDDDSADDDDDTTDDDDDSAGGDDDSSGDDDDSAWGDDDSAAAL